MTLGYQHPVCLPKDLVRVVGKIQGMQQHNQVQGIVLERQGKRTGCKRALLRVQ